MLKTCRPSQGRLQACMALLILATSAGAGAWAHQGPHANTPGASTPAADLATSRSTVQVKLPVVKVLAQTGKAGPFNALVDETRPVLLNFVFTTCTSICYPMSQVFAAAQEKLGEQAKQVQMISVSIDPGQDTPQRLAAYAARLDAGPQWTFNTGTQEAVDAIQRAFNVYRPDKMGHTPVTFIRPRGAQQWVRLDGFASPDRLIREALVNIAATP
jgi:protein SCO1